MLQFLSPNIKWHQDDPFAFKITSEGLKEAAPGCLPNMAEARTWSLGTNKMMLCKYTNGLEVQHLINSSEDGITYIYILTPQYLARDPSQRENLARGGDPRFEASEAVARRVALGEVASKMKETTNPPYASGPDSAVLVPSDDPVKCSLWGSTWTGSGEANITASLTSVGFRGIECPDKKWKP